MCVAVPLRSFTVFECLRVSILQGFHLRCQIIAEGYSGGLLLGPINDDSMVFIYANWSMTCWLTEEHLETALGLVTEGCIVVSDRMMISILPILVEPLEM